jgi:hypothetical protein
VVTRCDACGDKVGKKFLKEQSYSGNGQRVIICGNCNPTGSVWGKDVIILKDPFFLTIKGASISYANDGPLEHVRGYVVYPCLLCQAGIPGGSTGTGLSGYRLRSGGRIVVCGAHDRITTPDDIYKQYQLWQLGSIF